MGLWMLLAAAVLALTWRYFTSGFSYWKDKDVPFIPPLPLVGSMLTVLSLQEHMVEFFLSAYRKFEGHAFAGFFQGHSPVLLVRDPELAKSILVKDFAHFADHGFKVHEEADPLQAKSLFNLEGQRWKEMRAKLSPTFTSGRMKAMLPLVQECANELEVYLQELADEHEDFEAKDVLARYTTDTISSCAFGVRSNSIREPNCEFRVMGRKLIQLDFWRGLKLMFILFAPEISMRLRLAIMSSELTRYFRSMVGEVIELRAGAEAPRRDDFMQLLIELKERGCLAPEEGTVPSEHQDAPADTMKLTADDVTAQATVFFLAGFETSSAVMSFALYELARRPELQRKAREHIEEVLARHGGHLTYQALQDMTYLDWIMQESMRKYPPTTALIRVCTKRYAVPGGGGLTLDKGTNLVIPIHAMQNDPQYFPEPEHFRPERFADPEIKRTMQYVHMPFGEGPRQCIGYRFAKMQTKLGLLAALRRFEVSVSSKMLLPMQLDPRQPVPSPKGGFWLRLTRLRDSSDSQVGLQGGTLPVPSAA